MSHIRHAVVHLYRTGFAPRCFEAGCIGRAEAQKVRVARGPVAHVEPQVERQRALEPQRIAPPVSAGTSANNDSAASRT
jgi:hypothetical protein